MHLTDEVVEKVPHRQWFFTLPKRFRIFVRFDRSLLGKLSSLAYETVRKFLATELGDETAVPGIVAIAQTFGDIINLLIKTDRMSYKKFYSTVVSRIILRRYALLLNLVPLRLAKLSQG
ncbi:MAG: hypothetical protein JW795_00530 [Chitinivibrionales bacterium]|nr:hypothetical protein [Chitinivibrionales bacterium]